MTTPTLAQVVNLILRTRSFDGAFDVEWVEIDPQDRQVTFWVGNLKVATYGVDHPHYPHGLLERARWAVERELTTMSDLLLLSIAIESIQSNAEWAIVQNWPYYEELRDFMSRN